MIPHTFFTEIFMQRAVKTDQSEFRRAVDGPGRNAMAVANAEDRTDPRTEVSLHR
jgi:hypothetical protein